MQATDSLSHHEHDHEHTHPEAPRRDLQGWLKTALLIGLGLYFVTIIVSGSLTNYINANFAWLSYVAVALFLLLGFASALELLRPRGGHDHAHNHHDHEHDHEHAVISWRTLAVVAIPLVLGTLVPSRPLGSAAVNGNISVNAASGFTAFSSDPLTWNVLDWLRSFYKSDDISSFDGQRADVIGFVYREITFPEDQFMVARFTISCCVADASAIGLPVVWATGAEVPADTWVRVQGEFQVGEFRGDTVPILHALQVEVISQPEHPYLYP